MSLDGQKLDSSQRQQIMSTVQQQLALQNAQELLQVSLVTIPVSIMLCLRYFRNSLTSVSRRVSKNRVVLSQVLNRYEETEHHVYREFILNTIEMYHSMF